MASNEDMKTKDREGSDDEMSGGETIDGVQVERRRYAEFAPFDVSIQKEDNDCKYVMYFWHGKLPIKIHEFNEHGYYVEANPETNKIKLGTVQTVPINAMFCDREKELSFRYDIFIRFVEKCRDMKEVFSMMKKIQKKGYAELDLFVNVNVRYCLECELPQHEWPIFIKHYEEFPGDLWRTPIHERTKLGQIPIHESFFTEFAPKYLEMYEKIYDCLKEEAGNQQNNKRVKLVSN